MARFQGSWNTEWFECLTKDGYSSRVFFPGLTPGRPLTSFPHGLFVVLLRERSVPPSTPFLREHFQREQGREELCDFRRAAITNYHNWVGWFRNNSKPSQFWRLEIQNQSVGRATLSLNALGENPSLSLSSFWCLLVILGVPWHKSISFFVCFFVFDSHRFVDCNENWGLVDLFRLE